MLNKEWIRGQISIWFRSALISSTAIFVLLLIFIIFPEIKKYFSFENDAYFYIPFIGLWAPFRGTPLIFVILVPFIYCGFGFRYILSKYHFRKPNRYEWRGLVSNILLSISIAIFFFIIPTISVIWALAIKDWEIAINCLRNWEGNHGPWRIGLYHLRKLLNYSFLVPIGSFNLALFSIFIKPNKLAIIVMVSSLLLWLFLIWSHYWLID